MRVYLNGHPVYKLCFARRQYGTFRIGVKGTKIPLIETTALIYMVDAIKGEPAVAQATVRQSHKDNNCKETARRMALRRLCRNTDNPPFTRDERTAIWRAYWDRFDAPKATPAPAGATGRVLPMPLRPIKVAGVNTHPVTSRLVC